MFGIYHRMRFQRSRNAHFLYTETQRHGGFFTQITQISQIYFSDRRAEGHRGNKSLCVSVYIKNHAHYGKISVISVVYDGKPGGVQAFFQRRVMSSRVLPLVSGTNFQTKMAATTQITP